MNASFTARELWQFCQIIFREYLVEINFILFYSSRCYRKEEHNDKRFFHILVNYLLFLFLNAWTKSVIAFSRFSFFM